MIRLSDSQLVARVRHLRAREHDAIVRMLHLLAEIETRKVHLALGYPSLFAFATRHLRYSDSAAGRRVQAARCIRRHRELAALLRQGEVNLSTVALVSRVIDETNKKDIIARMRNRSQREVEALVAEHRPLSRVPDRVRAIQLQPGPVPATSARPSNQVSLELGPGWRDDNPRARTASVDEDTCTGSSRRADVAPDVAPGGSTDAGGTNVRTTVSEAEKHSRSGRDPGGSASFKVQFAASAGLMAKFEEARTFMSGRNPRGASFAEVFEAALDAFLDRRSPRRRSKRREQRREQRRRLHGKLRGEVREKRKVRAGETSLHRAGVVGVGRRDPDRRSSGSRARSKIPAEVRDAVYERDEGRCTYVGANGVRCGGRHDLEIDHRMPVARGGGDELENLRLLCAAHNQLEAERVFGRAWMRRAVALA